MKKLITLFVLCLCLTACKDEHKKSNNGNGGGKDPEKVPEGLYTAAALAISIGGLYSYKKWKS